MIQLYEEGYPNTDQSENGKQGYCYSTRDNMMNLFELEAPNTEHKRKNDYEENE